MGLFEGVSAVAPDAIFGLLGAFRADPRPHKMNLLVGYYQSDEGKTPVMRAVQEVRRREFENEYLPIEGDEAFLKEIAKLSFGGVDAGRMIAAQTLGGTGALRLFGDFYSAFVGKKMGLSDPTWPNHRGVFTRAGFSIENYFYYDHERHVVDFDALCASLERFPEKTAVLLHASCHNPTGMDLSMEQWEALSELFKRKRLFPFFDMAYQGLGAGLSEDAQGVRLFYERGHELALAYSCSKNFSLYGQRVGALFIVCDAAQENVRSQLRALIRTNYSNPPRDGAAIVREVLVKPKIWQEELAEMRARLKRVRLQFCEALAEKIPGRDWSFIERTQGLFCYTGLKAREVERLIAEFGIYMPSDGRLNIAALNDSNLDRLVDAISKL